jgi:hypothetical protein
MKVRRVISGYDETLRQLLYTSLLYCLEIQNRKKRIPKENPNTAKLKMLQAWFDWQNSSFKHKFRNIRRCVHPKTTNLALQGHIPMMKLRKMPRI